MTGYVNGLIQGTGETSILATATLIVGDATNDGVSYKFCSIEDLNLENGDITDTNNLIPLLLFAGILLRINNFCEENSIDHLIIEEVQSFRWFVNFLEPAGFQDCTCEQFGSNGTKPLKCLPRPIPYKGTYNEEKDLPTRSRSTESWRPLPFPEESIARTESDGSSTSLGAIEAGIIDVDSIQDKIAEITCNPYDLPRRSITSAKPGVVVEATMCKHWTMYGKCDFMHTRKGCKFSHGPAVVSGDGHNSSSPASGTGGFIRKIVYCPHWMRQGWCKYTAQTVWEKGCFYRHEFPKDEQTRLRVGIEGPPQWLQDDPRLKKLHWPSDKPTDQLDYGSGSNPRKRPRLGSGNAAKVEP